MNKEHGEKVAANFLIFVPYLFSFFFFNLQRKRITKLATLSGKRNCGGAERLDNVDRITLR